MQVKAGPRPSRVRARFRLSKLGRYGIVWAIGEACQAAARAPTMQAGCELNEVAGRAIEVERLARRQAEPSQPRPRLER